MAIEFITIADALGVQKKLAVDLFNVDEYAQAMKIGFGADGTFTLVEAAAPLPITALGMPAADKTTDQIGDYPAVDGYVNNRAGVVPVDVVLTASASGATAVVGAQGAGKTIVVTSVVLSASAAVNAKFQSASTDITGLLYLGTSGGFVLPEKPRGWFRTAANVALNINLSGAVAVGGVLSYVVI